MEEQIKKQFINGFDCGQVVLAHFSDRLGIDRKDAYKAAAGFGGGMFCGDTCGAVTGAFIALGFRYGQTEPGDSEKKELLTKKCMEFRTAFTERKGSCECRELLGYDLSKPGELEKVIESGLMMSFCPKAVAEAIHILEELLD